MMSLIIEYAYTRESTVTSDNVERLLPAADQVCTLYKWTIVTIQILPITSQIGTERKKKKKKKKKTAADVASS